MNYYHSDNTKEFTMDWEIPYNPKTDYESIAKFMIENYELSDHEKNMTDEKIEFESKKTEKQIFLLACSEIKAGRHIDHWTEIVKMHIDTHPIEYDYKFEAVKSLELLQAVKSKRLLKQLDMSDELDIKVHMEIIRFRNEIFNKYNLAIPCN